MKQRSNLGSRTVGALNGHFRKKIRRLFRLSLKVLAEQDDDTEEVRSCETWDHCVRLEIDEEWQRWYRERHEDSV